MKHKQVVIVGRSGPVLLYTECLYCRDFSIELESVHKNHCGGCKKPQIKDVYLTEHSISIYVELEPGDIAELTLKYHC